MRLRSRLSMTAVVVLLAGLLFPLAAAAQNDPVDLSGNWRWDNCSYQTYCYGGPATIEHNVGAGTFHWAIDGSGPDSSGHAEGDGTVAGTELTLKTSFVNDAGDAYTAEFEGDILDNGNRLSGTWTQSDGQSGTFTATRVHSSSPSPSPTFASPTPSDSPNPPPGVFCGFTPDGSRTILRIRGTQGADSIEVRPKPGSELEVEVVVNGEVLCTHFSSDFTEIAIDGYRGDDILTVSRGITKSTYISGGGGNDTIRGGSGPNLLHGGSDNDNDTIIGGPGDDRIIDESGDNKIDGGGGRDRILGGNGDDNIKGGPGPDTIKPGSGGNEVDGGPGEDTILDEIDEVIVIGTPVPGTLRATRGMRADGLRATRDKSHDLFAGGTGDDRIIAGGSTDTVIGGPGNDHLRGGKDNDVLAGGGGRDDLDGQGGSDRSSGGAGKDTLRGGAGSGDRCNGGPGRDRILVGGGKGCETYS